MKYYVCMGGDLDVLEQNVNDRLANGWKLHQGLVVIVRPDFVGYAQVVINEREAPL